jgi:hypothetical protein
VNPAAVPTAIGTADSARVVEQPGSAVDASRVALPAMRVPIDSRGLALGILTALASVLALTRVAAIGAQNLVTDKPHYISSGLPAPIAQFLCAFDEGAVGRPRAGERERLYD